jgi:hypothetical protein
MTETPAPYHYTPGQHRHTAILRVLSHVGWQAQRMGMDLYGVPPVQAAGAALRALDDLQAAIERARRRITEEAAGG